MDEFLRESQKLLSSPTATVSAAAVGGITGGGGAGQIGSAHTTPTKPRISLKEQESVIDALKKENFSLKMRVHYLQETLTDITSGMSGAEDVSSSLMEENVELKLKLKEMNELLQQKTVLVNDQSANDVPQVVRDTVVEYRKEIERLEADVKNLKSELLETTSQVKQRELDCDQLRAQNESLRLLSPVRSPHNQARGRPDSPSLFQGAYDSGVDAFGFSSSASKIAVSDEQLENGIGIMRQQINDLKLQLIEKSTLSDKLSLEIDSLRQMSQKQVDELNSLKQREEIRLQKTVNEMKSQIELLKRELQSKDEKLKTREKEYKENEVSFVVDKSQLESRIESMKREIDTLNRDFNEVRSEKRSLENALEMKRQQIEHLNRQLDNKTQLHKTTEIDSLRLSDQLHTRLDALQKEIKEKDLLLQGKDAEILLQKDQIERQKRDLVQVEDRWAQQSREVSSQQRQLRDELDKQVKQFKEKNEMLVKQLMERENEVKELTTRLDMHSVGIDETVRKHVEEKDQLREEVLKKSKDVEDLRNEVVKFQRRLEEVDFAYKESVASHDKLSFIMKQQEDKLTKYSLQIKEKDALLERKERELKEKLVISREINEKLLKSESSISEGEQISKVIEQRYYSYLEERNTLLVNLNAHLDEFFRNNELGISPSDFPTESPTSNFYIFADTLMEKLRSISSFPATAERKIQRAEQRMEEGFKLLHQKLERKSSHLDRFEKMVTEATQVQRSLRESLQHKQEELADSKRQVSSLLHELSIYKHELSTVQSEMMISLSSEKNKNMELTSMIDDMDRQLKDKAKVNDDLAHKLQEYEDALSRQKSAGGHRITEITEHAKLLKQELEISQKQTKQLEKLLAQQTQTNSMIRKSSMQSLLETSEAAMENLQARLKDEVEHYEKLLSKERQKSRSLEVEVDKMKRDLMSHKRRLEKRESMIEMALKKLEMVNGRREELSGLYAVTEDVRRMILRKDSDMSERGSSSSREREKPTNRQESLFSGMYTFEDTKISSKNEEESSEISSKYYKPHTQSAYAFEPESESGGGTSKSK